MASLPDGEGAGCVPPGQPPRRRLAVATADVSGSVTSEVAICLRSYIVACLRAGTRRRQYDTGWPVSVAQEMT